MTNEDLARLIQEGNEELHPVLWKKVYPLLYSKAGSFYNAHRATCDRCGVELSDLRQECYAVYLEAVRAYKPGSGIMFVTFLNYPFQNACNSLLGLRTERQRNEPLNRCKSLDEPLEGSDGDAFTLHELVRDETSTDFVEHLESIEEAALVRQAVEELPDQLRAVIKLYYFEGKTNQQIGDAMGESADHIRRLKEKALYELRRSKLLRQLYLEQKRHYTWQRFSMWEYSPEYYDLCRRMKERRLSYGYQQAELYAAREKWERTGAEQYGI